MAKKSASYTSKLVTSHKNTAQIEVTIPASVVADELEHAVSHLAPSVTVKGFRQGKAPLDLVKKELDPQKITEHALNHLLPHAVETAIKNHDIKPVALPTVSINNLDAGKDWIITLWFPLLPEFELGDYRSKIKQAKPADIWTPDQGKPDSKDVSREDETTKLFNALLSAYDFDVPESLVNEEVNQSLTRLLQQTQSLGLSIDDYLKSIGKTSDSLRQEYAKTATDNLKLEFVLAKISEDLNLQASDAEIDQLTAASGDAELKKRLHNPQERRYLASIITKRKTIDALLKL